MTDGGSTSSPAVQDLAAYSAQHCVDGLRRPLRWQRSWSAPALYFHGMVASAIERC